MRLPDSYDKWRLASPYDDFACCEVCEQDFHKKRMISFKNVRTRKIALFCEKCAHDTYYDPEFLSILTFSVDREEK